MLLDPGIERQLRDHRSVASASIHQKGLQREWHDRAALTERHYKNTEYDAPGLYSFILYYQLRRTERHLLGCDYRWIANVSAGTGFELRFLARIGRRVVATDISHASLLEALRLGQSLGLDVDAICCDSENLPFRDAAFDLVLAHHSLHHLFDKWRGLGEMTRVSGWRVAFFEPAAGPVRWLVRVLGLKPSVEESGNVVHEYGQRQTREFAESRGFRVVRFAKCLITGPPVEPKWFGVVDRAGVSKAIMTLARWLNAPLGWLLGTKCEVLMERQTRE